METNDERRIRYIKRLNDFCFKAAAKVEEEAKLLTGKQKNIKLWKAVEIRSLSIPLILR
jgi:hypothetical protein